MKAWLDYKLEIDFLSEELYGLLKDTFEVIRQNNEAIETATEGRGESILDSVNVDPLKAPLKRISEELDFWIKKNFSNPEYAPKRPRFFGW